MADTKISELTELESVAGADLLAVIDDPAGTPVTKKATVANVGAAIQLDNLAATDDNTDLNATATKHGLALKVSGTAGTMLVSDGTNQKYIDRDFNIVLGVGSGAAAVTTADEIFPVVVPVDCAIEGVTVLADQSGSIVVDLWKDTYANYPPTDADTITASAPPTLSSAIKSTDTTLTGWTKTMTKGDVLWGNVDSATTVQWALVVLHCRATATA